MRRYVCDFVVNALEQTEMPGIQPTHSTSSIDKSTGNLIKSPRGLVPKGVSNLGDTLTAASMPAIALASHVAPAKQHIFLFNDVLIVTHPKKSDKFEVISYVYLLNPLLREPQIQIAEGTKLSIPSDS